MSLSIDMQRGNPIGLPALAAELVRLKVDVIVTGWSNCNRAAKEATTTIPIVMAYDSDPVGNGIRRQPCATWRKHHWTVQPCPEISGKQLELLKEIVPKLSRVAVLGLQPIRATSQVLRETQARRTGVRSAASIPRSAKVPRILRLHFERKQGAC